MISELLVEFACPSPQWRGKPFWAWNGLLNQDELIRQIHVMRDMGFGGFFMHSRTGLQTPYLGDDWFALTNACADEAETLGLEAWLYDEDRWPSGTAGGFVTRDPAYRRRFIRLDAIPAAQFGWNQASAAVALFACDLNGSDCSNCRSIGADSALRADETVLVFTIEEMEPSSFYNGYTYADTMNPCATQRFIELTHEQYALHCGKRLGSSIKGIFTDEPHRGPVMMAFLYRTGILMARAMDAFPLLGVPPHGSVMPSNLNCQPCSSRWRDVKFHGLSGTT
jgi:hypothetical protein